MDTSNSAPSRAKKLKKKGRDRISNLPDNVLHHILSFLNMKLAVRTSILSKRWRYVWASCPVLNFKFKLKQSRRVTQQQQAKYFKDFVDRTLLLRDNSNIQRFNIFCENNLKIANRLNTWTHVAVKRNVQELLVDVIYVKIFRLPDCLFFCKSLTKLVLKTRSAGGPSWISLPDSMSLPALKTLHLEYFLLDDEDLITDLLTSSPVLESLIIMKCAFHRVNLNISSHKLRHLTLVKDKSGGCFVSNYASKDYEVKLNTPNLTSFICKDYMSKFYKIENLSSIVKVDINFDMEVEEEKEARSTYLKLPEGKKQTYATEKKKKKQLYAQQMMNILGVLYNVKDLTLSAWFLEVVSGALDIPDSPTIQFCNLRCLKLRTWRTMDCARIVMYLLELSPNIESLSVEFAKIPLLSPFFEKNPAGKDYWEERLSLNCMLHHLTSVKLEDFSGCYPELKFVEFLLKNAMNLQKLMICFSTTKNSKDNGNDTVLKLSKENIEPENSSSGVTGITTTMDDNRGDRISKLPDDILHGILSLLDMKEVVQTSILSSRWKYLWISMPSFNFNQVIFQSCETVASNSYRFVKFVDMVLQSKTSIKTLVLSCVSDYFVGSEQLHKWIVDAVRLKVSVLELEIVYSNVQKIKPLILPLCLFTCKTLTTLKLDLGFVTGNTLVLSLPDDSVCLTALKTLHLSLLLLIGEESTDTFFSRCPALETLSISNCRFEKAYKSNYLPSSIFTCGTLVSLKLKICYTLLVAAPIFNSIPDSVVILPSLKCLHIQNPHLFSGESTGNLFFSNCPSLESLILNECKLHVNADVLPRYVFMCKTLVKLNVVGCSSNKIFHISNLCSLPCLKALSLNSLCFPGGNITDNFFLGCPVLETLIISDCSYPITENFFLGCPVLKTLPCLKTLSLESFYFPGGEINVNFFLGCPVLETLILSRCSFTITENFFLGCPVLKTLIVSDCSFTISSFFCKSLNKLVLKTEGLIYSRVSLPDSMSLPALKTLHLESLLLNSKDSITNLLTSCPDLESLTIMQCAFHGVHLNIYSHKLRHLKLVNDKSRGSCVIIRTSKGNISNCLFDHYKEVKLNAPNLTSFFCKDYMSKVYTIENLSSIVQVYINLDMEIEELQEARPTHLLKQLPEDTKQTCATEKEKKKQLYAQQMMKILGGLYNEKVLTLSAWFLEVVSGALDLPDSPTIQFCNLRCLKLRTWRTMDCAHAVMYLLERSPNIESLSVEFAKIPLSSSFFEKNPAGKDNWEERLSLNCMLHHLMSVKLQDFTGCYPELKFVEFLLKNSMNLQKLMICFATIENPKNNAESRVVKVSEEEMLSLPRASASVEILFMP